MGFQLPTSTGDRRISAINSMVQLGEVQLRAFAEKKTKNRQAHASEVLHAPLRMVERSCVTWVRIFYFDFRMVAHGSKASPRS